MPNDPTRDTGFANGNKAAYRPGKSWFLGIGIDHYQEFTDLNNAVKDVHDIHNLLIEHYDIDPNCTILLCNEAASREQIIDQLDDLTDAITADDKLIIYYSGHGHLNKRTGLGFWIPHDAKKGRTANYIRNSTIRDYIKVINAHHTLLISDSCFSGSLFVRGANRSETALEELEQRVSRWAICSGRHDEEVYDGEPGRNSPFADSIMDILGSNRKTKMNVAKLADRVIELTRANYEQLPEGNPLQGVGHKGGQYVFRLKAKEPAWQSAWQDIQSLPEDTVAQITQKILRLDEYLDQFPTTTNLEAIHEKGEYLEHKLAFLQAQSSLFRLRKFTRRQTPFQQEALRLIDAMKEGFDLPEEPSVKPEPEGRKEKADSDFKVKPKVKQNKNEPASDSKLQYGSFTDPRDGQTYTTIAVKGLVWMVKNFNFKTRKGSWIYEKGTGFLGLGGTKPVEGYGRLYTWKAAKKACPLGWHLPTDDEWKHFINILGGVTTTNKNFSEKIEMSNINRRSIFRKLPMLQLGGFRNANGVYTGFDTIIRYWSATKDHPNNASSYSFHLLGHIERDNINKQTGLSCWYVQD